MDKIKKIIVSDFRIYNGNKEFSFVASNNEIANLVTIYGPNGFGKSSFFDAVQWSLTGQVKRFSQKGNAKNAANNDGKYILTNRDAAKDGRLGKVELHGDKTKLLERKVEARKKQGLERRDDYKSGKTTKKLKFTKDLNCDEAKVLSQDQIDAFVRHESLEDKYETLISFWHEGHKATEFLNANLEKFRYTKKQLEECEKDINRKKDELAKYTRDPEKKQLINSQILELKEVTSINFSIPLFGEEVTEDDYNVAATYIAIYLKDIKDKISEVTLEIERLAALWNDADQYEINNTKLSELNKKVLELKAIDADYREIENQAITLSEIEDSINKKNKEISDYTKLLENKTKFSSVTSQLDKLVEKSGVLIQNKLKQQKLLVVGQDKLSKLKADLASEKNKISALEEQIETIRIHCNQYDVTKRELKEIDAVLNRDNKISATLEQDIKALLLEKQNFEAVKSSYSIRPIAKIDNQDLQHYIAQRTELLNTLVQLKQELEKQELAYTKSGSLNENLNRIIKWGEAYTAETKVSVCPLCESPFDSFDLLLSSIRKDKTDALALTEQEEKIADKRNEIDAFSNQIKDVETSVTTIVGENISLLKSHLVDKQRARDALNEDISSNKSRKLICEQQISTINLYFSNTLKVDITSSIEAYNEFKIQQENVLHAARKLFDSRSEKILADEISVTNIKTSLVTLDTDIDIINTETKVLEMGELYTETKELLAKYEEEKLYEPYIKLADNIEDKLRKKMKDETQHAELLSLKKVSLATLKTKPAYVEKAELDGVVKIANEQIYDLQVVKKFFDSKYQKLTQSVVYDRQLITQAQDKNKALCEELTNAQPKLEILNVDLKCILDDVKFNQLKQSLSTLDNYEKKKLTNTLNKLAAVKDTCEEYIKEGVDKHFNKNTINAIYQRISPHPHYKEIDFKVSFSDTGKARLNITAKSKLNGGESVDPLLYMSSGQINVLSLSIFLAKALHEKQGLATIFIDDPVQNLSDMNILSFVDLLRTLISEPHNKQIVISTHDESFFKLLKNKMPEQYYSTKYLQLSSFGMIDTK